MNSVLNLLRIGEAGIPIIVLISVIVSAIVGITAYILIAPIVKRNKLAAAEKLVEEVLVTATSVETKEKVVEEVAEESAITETVVKPVVEETKNVEPKVVPIVDVEVVDEEPEEVTEKEEKIVIPAGQEIVAGAVLKSTDDEEIVIKEVSADGYVTFIKYKKSFMARYIQAPDEIKRYYNVFKNAMLSYAEVGSRINWGYDTLKRHNRKVVQFNVRNNQLYAYLAMEREDIDVATYSIEYSKAKKYKTVPSLYKINDDLKSEHSLDIVELLAKKYNLEKIEREYVDYYLPYETREQLIKKGYIKEVIIKQKI